MSSAKIVPNKPFLLLLYGFPGSGKTAFARELADEIKAAHLQQDRLAHELYGESSEKTQTSSRQAMNYMAREFLRAGVSVVYDADAFRLGERRKLRELARATKVTPLIVWIQIDPDTAFIRARKRDRRKADDHYAREINADEFGSALNKMQNPTNEDYVVISGKHTFHTQKAAVLKKFYELGILTPEQLSGNMAKPELVNLVPQPSIGGRPEITRRNITIR